MQYRYVTTKQNYEDYAAGRVIIATRGSTSFPVRLASEIFQRCQGFFDDVARLSVYDPCCGNGYLLTIIGFLHGDHITALQASDIDANAVEVARDNLALLTPDGLHSRRDTIQHLYDTHGKSSHRDALQSVDVLSGQLPSHHIRMRTWQANAIEQSAAPDSADMMLCDVSYGDHTAWQSVADKPLQHILETQYPVLKPGGIAAIISDKTQKAAHPRYTQIQHETIGKRRFVILQKD